MKPAQNLSLFALLFFFACGEPAPQPASLSSSPTAEDSIFRDIPDGDTSRIDSIAQFFEVVEPPKEDGDVTVEETDEWPYVKYSYAKAFGFNMHNAKNPRSVSGSIIQRDGSLNSNVYFESKLSEKEAAKVQQQVERAEGTRILTKCPFQPRHAVVFFGENDEPLAAMNVCFSCQDMVAQPDVNVEDEDKKDPYKGDGFDKLIPELEKAYNYYEKLFKNHDMPVYRNLEGRELQ